MRFPVTAAIILCFMFTLPARAELIEGQSVTNAQPAENVPQLLVPPPPPVPPPPTEPVKISSVFGTQPLKLIKLPFEDVYPTGPFEMLPDGRFLFISKCGDVYFAKLEGEFKLEAPAQPLTRPTAEGDKPVAYCKDSSGVKDSLLLGNSVFVAYNAWDAENNGVRMAVTEYEIDADGQGLSYKREIFLSTPAIKEPILGLQTGGKLALGENDQTLYLSVGDFSRPEKVQDKTSTIGKVIRIDLRKPEWEIYATGIRSPSGGMLYDRASNELWLTEHGPRGGDEVNLIRKGRNYGWPLVSYGTIYERDGMGSYYGNKFNTHEGFEKPAMTFVPSIGIGPIAKYPPTGKNDYWDNDYFIAGMGSTTLLRVRKEGTSLVYAEPVLSGFRIRAMKIDKDGRFYLKTEHNQLLISE
jgi:glucose/arabinose dehydrogenase